MGMGFDSQTKHLDDLKILLFHPAAFATPFTIKLAEWAADNFPNRFYDIKEVRLHSVAGIVSLGGCVCERGGSRRHFCLLAL